MIERFGLALHVFDVGAGPASGVGYATAIGAMIIPVIFLLNVAMLVTRLTNDIQQVQNVLMMGLRMAMRAPGMFIGALIMAFMMNARLAVVILVVIPLLTAAIAVILKTAFPRFTAMQKKLDQLNSGIQEALTNVRVIKYLCAGRV